MSALPQAAADFLSCQRIAVVGVSRHPQEAGNLIYRKLKDTGHQVFAVNPRADSVEGDVAYSDLAEIPGGVEAAVLVTPPAATAAVVRDCALLGISRVWMHSSFGEGSVSDEATAFCREHGIEVIPGACPMMFCDPVDVGHRCMRWVLGALSRLPEA